MGLTERDLAHVTGIETDQQTVETMLDKLRGLVSG